MTVWICWCKPPQAYDASTAACTNCGERRPSFLDPVHVVCWDEGEERRSAQIIQAYQHFGHVDRDRAQTAGGGNVVSLHEFKQSKKRGKAP